MFRPVRRTRISRATRTRTFLSSHHRTLATSLPITRCCDSLCPKWPGRRLALGQYEPIFPLCRRSRPATTSTHLNGSRIPTSQWAWIANRVPDLLLLNELGPRSPSARLTFSVPRTSHPLALVPCDLSLRRLVWVCATSCHLLRRPRRMSHPRFGVLRVSRRR